MSRFLGLDVGEKTIGIAMTDENGMMAFPGETIRRQEGWRRDMAALRALVAANKIGKIVVGLPLMMDGTSGVQARKIEQFVDVLKRSVRIPVVMQDERLTTREANRLLMQAELNYKERKRSVDSIAACLLLQSYLDLAAESLAAAGKEAEIESRNADGDEVTV